jgi:hypothetical protein
MRFYFLLLILLPGFGFADVEDHMTPLPVHTQEVLLLFPLGVIVLTILLVVWHRRKLKKQSQEKK